MAGSRLRFSAPQFFSIIGWAAPSSWQIRDFCLANDIDLICECDRNCRKWELTLACNFHDSVFPGRAAVMTVISFRTASFVDLNILNEMVEGRATNLRQLVSCVHKSTFLNKWLCEEFITIFLWMNSQCLARTLSFLKRIWGNTRCFGGNRGEMTHQVLIWSTWCSSAVMQ